jgi:1-acyl-sn-glycerol-3-phosphate acyltransferase
LAVFTVDGSMADESVHERTFLWKSLQAFARICTTVLFDLKVEGQQHIPASGGAIILSNHQSYLDPVALGVKLRRPLSYLAKSELFKNRAADWLIRQLNGFPVRQGAGDVGAMKETIHRLHEGHLLNIYPEGTRTLDGEIGVIERGVALVVRRAKVPVIPAVIVGAFEAWPIQRKMFRSWPVRVRFGPALHLDGLSPAEVIATIDRTLRTMFDELRSRSRFM